MYANEVYLGHRVVSDGNVEDVEYGVSLRQKHIRCFYILAALCRLYSY